jgi:small-conductance mechanosensitive channel
MRTSRHEGTSRAVLAVALLVVFASGVRAQEPPADTVVQADTTLALDTIAPAEEIEPITDLRAAQDEAIRNQLQAIFDRVPDLAGVEVTVDAGVVHLEGTVVRSDTRTRAGQLAEGLEGVLFLDNRIRESTSLEEQLRPTWDRLRERGLGAVAKLPLLVVALFIVALAAWLGALLGRVRGTRFQRGRSPLLQGLVPQLVRGALVVAALLVALDLLNATALVGAVVGTAGLAGLALGFAFKDIAENYLAGALLAVRRPFDKNDHIEVDRYAGKVVRMTPRETIMMTLDGNHVRLPNALIFRSPIVNYTRNPLRRFEFEAGLGTGDDLARARDVAVATLLEMDGILPDPPPQAFVMALGASTVTMRFMAWIDQRKTDWFRIQSEAIRMVKSRLEAEGLSLPSPEFLVQLEGAQEAPLRVTRPPRRPAGEAPAPAMEPTTQADVSVDHALDRQIEEDRQATEEPDLLEQTATENPGPVPPPGAPS